MVETAAGRLSAMRRFSRIPLRGSAAILACFSGTAAVAPDPTATGHANIQLLSQSAALIMTGTDMHTVDQPWIDMAINNYIQPTLGGEYSGNPVETPAEFWPFGGPDDMLFDLSVLDGTHTISTAIAAQTANGAADSSVVVFGYSQSAVIATNAKRQLAEDAAAQADAPDDMSFVMLANLNRPNGGINSRFPGAFIEELGWTFSPAAPTDTPFTTVDVARQYDLFADFPQYPLNPFATANALLATLYGAHDYTEVTLDPTDPRYNPNTVVQHHGDTTYYFIPSETLPLLQPLHDLGVDPVLLDAAEPALRLLVEYGYDRSTPFGQPAPAVLTRREDFDQLSLEVAAAVEQGRAMLEAAAPPPAAAPSTAVPPVRGAAKSPTLGSVNSGTTDQPPPATPVAVTEPRRATRVSAAQMPQAAAGTGRTRAATPSASRPDTSPASRSRR